MWSPVLTSLDHRIEYSQQLAHTSRQRQLLRFSCRQQPLVEDPEHRIVSAGDQRSHVEHSPHSGSAAPDTAPAPMRTAIPIERCHPDQSDYPLAVESAQLRQVCQQ